MIFQMASYEKMRAQLQRATNNRTLFHFPALRLHA